RKAQRSTGFQPAPVANRVALPLPSSTPTRSSTQNIPLGPGYDFHFTIGANQKNFQWTHRESNPDFQSAGLVSSRWTMSPSTLEWTGRGVEPRSSACRAGVFPLDQPPESFTQKVRPGIEPGLPPYQGGVLP